MTRKQKIIIAIIMAVIVLATALLFIVMNINNPKCTVIFDPAGGSIETNTIEIRYGSTYDLPFPSREGYAFSGWLLNGKPVALKGNNWQYKDQITLVAKWELKQKEMEVKLDTNGGALKTQSVFLRYGDPYKLPTPTKEHFDFGGWYYNGNLVPLSGTNWPFKEVTLTAHWLLDGESKLLYNSTENGYTIKEYTGGLKRFIVIPYEYKNAPVLSIEYGAFDKLIENLEAFKYEFVTICIPKGIFYSDELKNGNPRIKFLEYSDADDYGLLYYDKGSSYSAIGYIGDYSEDEIIIPYEHNGKPVDEIGEFLFFESQYFVKQDSISFYTQVYIPMSVKNIGRNAFAKSYGLDACLYKHKNDGSISFVFNPKDVYGWESGVKIAIGNDELLDVINDRRPAFGWGIFSNAHYYAILNPNGGTVTKETSYGTVTISYVEFLAGSTSPYTLPTPKRDGYVFDGWYVGNTKVGLSDVSWKYTSNVELVAHWIPITGE